MWLPCYDGGYAWYVLVIDDGLMRTCSSVLERCLDGCTNERRAIVVVVVRAAAVVVGVISGRH